MPRDIIYKNRRRLTAFQLATPAFAAWELVRQSRLSVMPVPPDHWQLIQRMAAGSDIFP
ncbi:MAG TPA: EVE domain-containing protein [Methylomusa anaerophila]|uniref:EVE domain-containing protein n=1 Tax=Methylomusa anaerophila TaxID=1930071 RepID=UPI000F837E8C|nr:EVE domain-containing protein [Methylomusa anaerophila]HML89885.1 EVE domain-containing protein [Methylomusa anaerophila]